MGSDEQGLMRTTMRELTFSEATLLIIDDNPAMVMFLQGLLEKVGYTRVLSTIDSREAVDLFEALPPDLVILDLNMPHIDGFEVLRLFRERIPETHYLPILVLTGNVSPEARQRALLRGAKDFLTKPFEPIELLLRLHNLLEARFLHLRLHQRNAQLATRVRQRTRQLLEAQSDTIERLAQVVEFHDDETGRHTRRVGEWAGRIASRMGLATSEVELIRRAAPLHDVGKIGIPESILLKPERLTPQEFEVVKMHTSIGARILAGGRSEYLAMAEEIALGHHERWDGSGYPQGLRGDETPVHARIVAVADYFDALTHARPYREAVAQEEVLEQIDAAAGRLFDPRVVRAFLDAHLAGALPAAAVASTTL
jgi:putative two-component system response regulator